MHLLSFSDPREAQTLSPTMPQHCRGERQLLPQSLLLRVRDFHRPAPRLAQRAPHCTAKTSRAGSRLSSSS
ncbi:hypothetical protein NDU88_006951 [Pleurodeles waltl]|uniref:Uncharacterized protein n=1 Tax=Pleurodeles waltl TaxID=8319 RepID=A0AAV7QM95_PLEWA|nr:hypothetical protein NDU88_006951 [Pleurodeles waltl]